MKQVPQALNIRSLILQNFEKATIANSDIEKCALLNFVIVGGGPTGVELAGAIAELKNHIVPRDYPDLDASLMGNSFTRRCRSRIASYEYACL